MSSESAAHFYATTQHPTVTAADSAAKSLPAQNKPAQSAVSALPTASLDAWVDSNAIGPWPTPCLPPISTASGDAWSGLSSVSSADSALPISITALQWLRARAQPALDDTLSSKRLKRMQALAPSGLQPALSWGALLKELQSQRSRRLQHDCAEENVWLRNKLRDMCNVLASPYSRIADPVFINQDLRRRLEAVNHLVVKFDSEPVGPKSILKPLRRSKENAKPRRKISFNPELEIGPHQLAASAALRRMKAAWKV